ncbi:alpha/beta fold hydrolase [Pedobacter sp. AW31-3R]|uniref:alpha/beta fold hydrolase n=1 Tax=Pedobacter sp. AW31-3R TaxID=3445781 RepID=UPI003F9EED70
MKHFLILVLSFLLFGNVKAQQSKSNTPLRYFSQVGASPKNEIQYGNNPKAGHYVTSGDARIYYEVYGKGHPLLILHGGGVGAAYEMHQFIDSLSKKYQVIAMSTRGHGKSETGSEAVTYEQRANDAATVIDAVTKDSVVVLAFSDGAYSSYKLASMYPQKVRKMVAIGAGEQYPALRRVMFDPKQMEAADPLYWKQQMSLSPDSSKIPAYYKRLETFYNTMSADKALFNTIKCPVLVLAGERDKNALLPSIIATYQMIPNSQLGIIPHGAHPVFLENFPAVWNCIVPFLEN